MSERLLSIRKAAEQAGIPHSTLRKIIMGNSCPFPVFRPAPSLYYIDPTDIDRWKATCTRGGKYEKS
jgi:hypothetical protein